MSLPQSLELPDLSMHQAWQASHLDGANLDWMDGLYEQYLEDPSNIPSSWREYFSGLPQVDGHASEFSHAQVRKQFIALARQKAYFTPAVQEPGGQPLKLLQVQALIDSYRMRGHQHADIDPLNLSARAQSAELTLAFHRLHPSDLDTVFHLENTFFPDRQITLRALIQQLEQTYCSTLGVEFMYLADTEQKRWMQQRLESVSGKPQWDTNQKLRLFAQLTAAEGLEKSLATKYPGTKRFGLEGGESLIPLLDDLIQRAGEYEVRELVFGMAHRGRLNVLVNILGKNPTDLFAEFEGRSHHAKGTGDVKYHLGFSSNVMTAKGQIHLALAFNPSHLEIVSPVVEGSVRARQDRRGDQQRDQVVPVIVHGDAAIAGQGVVMETFQMMNLNGFSTGGTVHIVINNQIGFTTSLPDDARSTEYCTDVAKIIQAPILHVNADDPEAVLFAARIALDFRMTFHRDVVIDLTCYRRHGHNEADEPSATQPLMYHKIRTHPTTRTLYAQQLVAQKIIDIDTVKQQMSRYRAELEAGRHSVQLLVTKMDKSLFVDWNPYLGHRWSDTVDTTIEKAHLQRLAARLDALNTSIPLQKQVHKLMLERAKMTNEEIPVNWGYAEILAYASILDAGFKVRITGQDSGRGTFAHRHAILHHYQTGERFIPLRRLHPNESRFSIYDSFLSEEAVLGFEYGYATTNPRALIIWEAQFGDFANGAQVVIDQFLTSGEDKWQRLCGLVCLLPHGYEGQGPEHSSARLERFLQQSADNNIQVCTPTTAAQIFHMLRRQMLRPLRKPLIVMSPKSLLRSKLAASDFDTLCTGGFSTVIADAAPQPSNIHRIILCCGKVYYDLAQYAAQQKIEDCVIIRLEQLYPFPSTAFDVTLRPYRAVKKIVWAQEEPRNQGAWYTIQHAIRHALHRLEMTSTLEFAGRPASASPASGYFSVHQQQQQHLVVEAFTT